MAKGKSSGSVLKYPLKPPVAGSPYLESTEGPTGRMDFLRFQRFRVNYSDTQYGGLNLPDNKATTTLNPTIAYLTMPHNITANYSASYNQANMGVLGIAATRLASAITDGMGGEQLNEMLTDIVQRSAGGALPEMLFNKGATAIQSLNQMGSLGGDITGNTLSALSQGKVMNPYTEQVFQGINFRNHSFTIKMLARNKKEAKEILNIIQYFKEGSLPILEDAKAKSNKNNQGNNSNNVFKSKKNTKLSTAGRYLKVPDYFALEFVRLNMESDTISPVPHYKFQPCVCQSVNVNYTPDGQYVSFKDAISDLRTNGDGSLKQMMVPAVELTLNFAEARIVTQADAVAGF